MSVMIKTGSLCLLVCLRHPHVPLLVTLHVLALAYLLSRFRSPFLLSVPRFTQGLTKRLDRFKEWLAAR